MRDTLYRFHGRANPANRAPHPIRAELGVGETDDPAVAKLFLYDPIDSWGGYWGTSAKEFVEALAGLPTDTNEIRLHINSPGGEVYEGIAIMNALRNHPAKVVAVVDGLAASAASFVAAAADEVVMGRNSELMIHDAWGIVMGPAADMRYMADRLDSLSNNIASVYQRKAGGTVDEWRATMIDEKWFSDQEAVNAGLADRIEGDDPAPAAQAKASFDLAGMFRTRAAAGPAAPEPDYTPPPIPTDPRTVPDPAPVVEPVPAESAPVDLAARFRDRQNKALQRATS